MLLEAFKSFYHYEFFTPDAITAKLPFVGKPSEVFILTVFYLLFVLKLGPAFMRNRPAYNLKSIILIYNVIQILLNAYIVIKAYIMIICHRAYDLRCMSGLPDDHPQKTNEITCFYLYYLLKFIDLFDTIFFVLRKSKRQITFLHVYHHILMSTFGYFYFRYHGVGGHIASMGILNSIVHIFMYGYYFVSALKPDLKGSIWWKKYITRLQLLQFILIVIHNLYPILFKPNCNTPMLACYIAVTQGIYMLALFGNFYKKAYMSDTKSCRKELRKEY